MLHLDFDPLDVPHDRFIIAGDAWQMCRAGRAEPTRFGLFAHGALRVPPVVFNVVRNAPETITS